MRSVKLATVLIVLGLSGGLAFVGGCEESDVKLGIAHSSNVFPSWRASCRPPSCSSISSRGNWPQGNRAEGVEVDALRQKIAAMEEELTKKEELIKSMQSRLMGMAPLPAELNSALEDLAKQHSDMIEYDPNHGLVKFKSDLLFEKGSDRIAAPAAEAIKALCGILNSEQAKDFHIIVAGHTDDIPIRRAQTQMQHPSNWYLSSHRAISVLNSLQSCGIAPTRLSTRGFGEYRPVAPNAPNKGGNPKNRRVEVYIVPAGT